MQKQPVRNASRRSSDISRRGALFRVYRCLISFPIASSSLLYGTSSVPLIHYMTVSLDRPIIDLVRVGCRVLKKTRRRDVLATVES